jgi:triphosphoribosyl-dephospho-CoA synthase
LDFVRSARAVAPSLARAAGRTIGKVVLEAVRATRSAIGKNTNLGIILLLAPLSGLPRSVLAGSATAKGRRALRQRLERELRRTTRGDAEAVYEAIRCASPGGLGSAARGDVRDGPSGTLLEMMRLARRRDLIALQYSNAFRQVITEGLPGIQRALSAGGSLEDAVINCFLELLARHGDSLIARKTSPAVSRRAAQLARRALDERRSRRKRGGRLAELDAWLRSDGHRRNPGSCADLTAAVLFLALAGGIIPADLAARTLGKDDAGPPSRRPARPAARDRARSFSGRTSARWSRGEHDA